MTSSEETRSDPAATLRDAQEKGTTLDGALSFFDSLETVTIEEMFGRWRGSGLPSGHPMDGILEKMQWYGKEFRSAEFVHPLLFEGPRGEIRAMDSRHMPLNLIPKLRLSGSAFERLAFSAVKPFLWTTEPRARLRMMEHRGKASATMIYDFLPVHDVFRRVDADTLLGLMDLRGEARPFFFVLRRDSAI